MRDTRIRILDAVIDSAATFGLSRLTLEDVARGAGVSRQTLYRYFGSRDALIAAAVLREEERLLARMEQAAAQHVSFRPALEAAIAEALRAAREHPLLDRLLATEPETLLPYLLSGDNPVLSAAEPAVRRLLQHHVPHLTDPQLARVADACARLVVSYAISPSRDAVDDLAAGLADLIVDGVKSD